MCYLLVQNNIDSLFNSLSKKLKDAPSYQSFIDYYSDLESQKQNNKIVIDPQAIRFYEDNVDNFSDFKDVLMMKIRLKNYIKEIESVDKTLEKLKYIREKYIFIKKELQEYLHPNQENYVKYYEEWKAKNAKFVVENYELKDVIDDIKHLNMVYS